MLLSLVDRRWRRLSMTVLKGGSVSMMECGHDCQYSGPLASRWIHLPTSAITDIITIDHFIVFPCIWYTQTIAWTRDRREIADKDQGIFRLLLRRRKEITLLSES